MVRRKPRKKWKYETDNKLRAFGETDYENKTIKVNKKRHKSSAVNKISPKKDGNEHLGHTIMHEELHRRHPRMLERTVRKKEKTVWDALTPKKKRKMYSLFA